MNDFRLDHTGLAGLSPDNAAAYWLVRRDRGLSPSEEVRFASWLRDSEAHADAWARAEHVWASFDAEPDILLESMRVSALRARPNPAPEVRRGLIAASAAAAVLLAGMGGWLWLRLGVLESGKAQQIAAVAKRPLEYATADGARASISLSDGTQVTLDSATVVDVDFTASQRDVHLLHGQAFFAVKHDAHRPFSVHAAGQNVTDLGTEFNVCIGRRGMTVVVAKGSVVVSQASKTSPAVRVAPGQKYRGAPGQTGEVVNVDVDQALAWLSGYLDFRDEPLAEAVAEMNRHGGQPMTVGDPAAESLRVTGRFRTGDPARFARVLAEVYPVRIKRSGDREVIVHR